MRIISCPMGCGTDVRMERLDPATWAGICMKCVKYFEVPVEATDWPEIVEPQPITTKVLSLDDLLDDEDKKYLEGAKDD